MTTSRKTSLKALAAIGAACLASALVTPQAAGRSGVSDRFDVNAPDRRAPLVAIADDPSSRELSRPVLATAD